MFVIKHTTENVDLVYEAAKANDLRVVDICFFDVDGVSYAEIDFEDDGFTTTLWTFGARYAFAVAHITDIIVPE